MKVSIHIMLEKRHKLAMNIFRFFLNFSHWGLRGASVPVMSHGVRGYDSAVGGVVDQFKRDRKLLAIFREEVLLGG
jgi:hypothetical protein